MTPRHLLSTTLLALALAGGVAGCGAAPLVSSPAGKSDTPSEAPAATPRASATAPGNGPLVVTADYSVMPWTLRIVDRTGATVASRTIDINSGPMVEAVGSRGAYLVDRKGALSVLGPDGATTQLGAIPGLAGPSLVGEALQGLAESPDGSRWVASVAVVDPTNANPGTVSSRLYVGDSQGPPRLVTSLGRDNILPNQGGYGGGFQVLRWDAAGVLLGTAPINVGGAGPFIEEGYRLGAVVRLDPGSGMVTPVAGGCAFGDVGPAGTVACREKSDIKLLQPGGGVLSIPVAGGGTARWGGIAFAGADNRVLYAVASPEDANGWTDTLHVVSVTGSVTSDQVVITGLPAGTETFPAWNAVVGPTAVAVISGTSGGTTAQLVDLGGGPAVPLGPAGHIVGVIHPAG